MNDDILMKYNVVAVVVFIFMMTVTRQLLLRLNPRKPELQGT